MAIKLSNRGKKYTNMIYAKTFKAINGRTVSVEGKEMLTDCLKVMEDLAGIKIDINDFFQRLYWSVDEKDEIEFTHLITNTVMGDPQICVVVNTKEAQNPKNLADDYGIFCFVYNANYPVYSEYGYCFFEAIEGSGTKMYKRVG